MKTLIRKKFSFKIFYYIKNNYPKIIFGFIFAILLAKGFLLIYPDLNLLYPFMAPDSYDWIANGLHYEGYEVNFTFRPPGLPLIIALLDKFYILNFLPLLNQLVLFGILFLFFKIIDKQFNKLTATITTLILFFNFFLQNLSLFILADIYAVFFILLGLYFYLEAKNDERKYLQASFFWSVSFLFQYAVVFIFPAVLIHFLNFRKKVKPILFLKIFLLAILFPGVWFLYKEIISTDLSITEINYLKLLKLHFDSLFFYLINTIAVLGIFAFVFFILGLYKEVKVLYKKKNPAERIEFSAFNLLGVVSWFAFWVLLYNWNDRRFIVYLLPFAVPFIALAVNLLLDYYSKGKFFKKSLTVILIMAGIIWSALPYESALTFDTLRLTKTKSLKFKMVIDKDFKGNIIASSTHLSDDSFSYLNPIDFENLALLRKNIALNDLEELNKIKSDIINEDKDSICIKYENADFDKARWYIDRNRYENYFKRKVFLYPDCNEPNLIL